MGSLYQEFRRLHEIALVWSKGICVEGYDAAIWRKDSFGSWMNRAEYGNCSSIYGWEIDHVWPASRLGMNTLDNKQPLNWQNNRSKSDNTSFLLYGGL